MSNQTKKYPGVLGKRNNDMPPNPPPKTILGEPDEHSIRKYEGELEEWKRRQQLRQMYGVLRLLEHYEIGESKNRFFILALALAHDHVPYLMEPKRGRGRPKTTQAILPAIDAMTRLARSEGLSQSSVYELFAQILNVDKKTVIREVKRFRQKSDDGEKEN